MYDIKASKKMGDGILISFEENGTNKFETYTFGELVDMKINAINLLERPMLYRVHPAAHKIVSRT